MAAEPNPEFNSSLPIWGPSAAVPPTTTTQEPNPEFNSSLPIWGSSAALTTTSKLFPAPDVPPDRDDMARMHVAAAQPSVTSAALAGLHNTTTSSSSNPRPRSASSRPSAGSPHKDHFTLEESEAVRQDLDEWDKHFNTVLVDLLGDTLDDTRDDASVSSKLSASEAIYGMELEKDRLRVIAAANHRMEELKIRIESEQRSEIAQIQHLIEQREQYKNSLRERAGQTQIGGQELQAVIDLENQLELEDQDFMAKWQQQQAERDAQRQGLLNAEIRNQEREMKEWGRYWIKNFHRQKQGRPGVDWPRWWAALKLRAANRPLMENFLDTRAKERQARREALSATIARDTLQQQILDITKGNTMINASSMMSIMGPPVEALHAAASMQSLKPSSPKVMRPAPAPSSPKGAGQAVDWSQSQNQIPVGGGGASVIMARPLTPSSVGTAGNKPAGTLVYQYDFQRSMDSRWAAPRPTWVEGPATRSGASQRVAANPFLYHPTAGAGYPLGGDDHVTSVGERYPGLTAFTTSNFQTKEQRDQSVKLVGILFDRFLPYIEVDMSLPGSPEIETLRGVSGFAALPQLFYGGKFIGTYAEIKEWNDRDSLTHELEKRGYSFSEALLRIPTEAGREPFIKALGSGNKVWAGDPSMDGVKRLQQVQQEMESERWQAHEKASDEFGVPIPRPSLPGSRKGTPSKQQPTKPASRSSTPPPTGPSARRESKPSGGASQDKPAPQQPPRRRKDEGEERRESAFGDEDAVGEDKAGHQQPLRGYTAPETEERREEFYEAPPPPINAAPPPAPVANKVTAPQATAGTAPVPANRGDPRKETPPPRVAKQLQQHQTSQPSALARSQKPKDQPPPPQPQPQTQKAAPAPQQQQGSRQPAATSSGAVATQVYASPPKPSTKGGAVVPKPSPQADIASDLLFDHVRRGNDLDSKMAYIVLNAKAYHGLVRFQACARGAHVRSLILTGRHPVITGEMLGLARTRMEARNRDAQQGVYYGVPIVPKTRSIPGANSTDNLTAVLDAKPPPSKEMNAQKALSPTSKPRLMEKPPKVAAPPPPPPAGAGGYEAITKPAKATVKRKKGRKQPQPTYEEDEAEEDEEEAGDTTGTTSTDEGGYRKPRGGGGGKDYRRANIPVDVHYSADNSGVITSVGGLPAVSVKFTKASSGLRKYSRSTDAKNFYGSPSTSTASAFQPQHRSHHFSPPPRPRVGPHIALPHLDGPMPSSSVMPHQSAAGRVFYGSPPRASGAPPPSYAMPTPYGGGLSQSDLYMQSLLNQQSSYYSTPPSGLGMGRYGAPTGPTPLMRGPLQGVGRPSSAGMGVGYGPQMMMAMSAGMMNPMNATYTSTATSASTYPAGSSGSTNPASYPRGHFPVWEGPLHWRPPVSGAAGGAPLGPQPRGMVGARATLSEAQRVARAAPWKLVAVEDESALPPLVGPSHVL